MSFRSLLAFLFLSLLASACAVSSGDSDGESAGSVLQPLAGGPGQCAILCIAPPDGCEYKGGIYTGPCNAVHCGHLVCGAKGHECPVIDCAAPPPGCHYEGMVLSPCNQQTCGTLVCDSSSL